MCAGKLRSCGRHPKPKLRDAYKNGHTKLNNPAEEYKESKHSMTTDDPNNVHLMQNSEY